MAIDSEVADDGKFGERLKLDGLIEFIDQRRASHAGLAIDEHGAGAADFFEAVGVVGNGRGLFAVAGDGIFGDVAQADDDVHRGTPVKGKLFPIRRALRADLPFDPYDDFLFGHKSSKKLFCRVIAARSGRNLRNVDRFVCQLNIAVDPLGARGLEPVGVVAIRKIGLVMGAAGFVTRMGAHGNDASE
jgi:hypothetical protein